MKAMNQPADRLPGRLKARRKALGLSQDEAARRVGVTLRTWQRWEAGSSGGLVHLADMARALETTPEELLGVATPEDMPRGLDDLAMEARLQRIEATQQAILETLRGLRASLVDPREVLREADRLLEEGPPESEDS